MTYIGNKDGYNNTVIIQQSNGYYAWYGNIKEEVKLPVKFIGLGEGINDLKSFDIEEYIYGLLKDLM